MEGERILSALKKQSEGFKSIFEDVKAYLAPVLGSKKQKNALEFEKLELFSLKLFKLCIEQLQKANESETAPQLVHISTLCMDSLLVCTGSSSKAPPLSFEKILLHFAKFCLPSTNTSTSLQHTELGLRVCRVLTDRLNDVQPHKAKKSSEIVNLHKFVYDILWKAALQLEQRQDVDVAKLCLNMRMIALESLISSGKFEICAMFKSAMKVDLRYRRACNATSTGCSQQEIESGSKSRAKSSHCKIRKKGPTSATDMLNTVLEFHSFLEHSCHISSLVHSSLSCNEFTAGIGYLLCFITLCLKSAHLCNEGRERLSMTLDLCAKHGEGCGEEGHVIVQAQANCLQLWNAIREEEGNNFLDQSLLYLNILTDSMDDVISSNCHHDNHETVHWLAESLELVFSYLRRRREACRATEREGGASSSDVILVPRSAFQSFRSFILSSVSFLEIMLKVLSTTSMLAQQEYSIRQNQLVLLSLLADSLVDLLCEDDIEVLRSSASDSLISLETTPTPHPKKELAECCIPLIRSSQQIINKAGSNVLSESERKWVANDAHRLGQALCNCDFLTEACQVLELSCHDLTMWCKTGVPSEEVQRSRSREARLLDRVINLCSVYCQNGDYCDAMATMEKAITSLPTNQIAEQETVSLLVGQWVRVKRHLANESSQLALEDVSLTGSGRSLASALNKVCVASDDIKILYLEAELNMYQSQSYETHSCEVTVVKELLSLHSMTESHSSLLHTARLTIQLSTICRSCHAHSGCDHAPCEPPLELLDDTVALLEPLITSLTPSHTHTLTQAHQHLATAYLWKAICTLEQHISSVGVTDTSDGSRDKEIKIELNLSANELSLMMSDDIIQCLFSAVESWEIMREKASTLNLSMSEVYHDPSNMLHSLHLTATLCLAHSQPVLALRCLEVLLAICTCHAPQLSHQLLPSYNNAVSLYNDLVLSTLGPRPHPLPKPRPVPSSCDLGRRELVEVRCSQMMADLASARMQLAWGGCDDTRKILLSMLSEPMLEQASTLTFMFVAKAKLLASEILQQRTFDLQSSDAFLHYIITNSNPSGDDNEKNHIFQLTPLELAVDAVKIFQKLANHRRVKLEQDNDTCAVPSSSSSSQVDTDLNKGFSEERMDMEEISTKDDEILSKNIGENCGEGSSGIEGGAESSLLVSSSVGAWDILIGLMSSLKCVSRLYLEQGIVKEAHHYAREGAMLARGLLLPAWYTEFLLLLCEIESVKGEYALSTDYCLQAAKLLECHTHCKQLLTVQGQSTVGGDNNEGQSAVGGGTTSDSTSCVKRIDYESSFDEDSFVDQMANLDIHTPPSSPQVHTNSMDVIKGVYPSLPAMELHPQACLCQVCTNPESLLQTARLVVQCCRVSLMQTKDDIENKGDCIDSSVSIGRVHLVTKALVSLKEMIDKRIEKCNKALESVSTPGAVERNEVTGVIIGGKENKPKTKGSTRSIKSAQQTTKKLSKLPSTLCSEWSRTSVAKSAAFQCVLADIAVTKAECSLIMERPKEAMEELESALLQLGQGDIDKELGVAKALLHYQMGVACVQEVELTQPQLAVQLYKESVKESDEIKPLFEESSVATKPKRTRAVRKTTGSVTRRTRNTTAKSNSAISSKGGSRKEIVQTPFSCSLQHFLTCYQLCFPSLPAIITREVCQWVGLLVRGWRGEGGGDEIAAHFVNAGMNCTLTHQTIYCLGKKIKKSSGLGSSPSTSKSTRHHIEEIEQTLSTANHPPSRNKLPLSPNRALLKGRGLLQQGSIHPPMLSYTQSLRHAFISDCSVITLCLAPKTHPTRQDHLVIAQTTCGGGSTATTGGGVVMGVVKLAPELLSEFDSILYSSAESVSLKERREWWGARAKLDKQLKGLVLKMESDCLGRVSSLISLDSSEFSTVVFVLGRRVQRLPWESLPVLRDKVVCRMPSLPFMAAHRIMLNSGDSETGDFSFNPHSAYYILNPHGDLKNTEKRFANFFSNERGWSGVIGSPPSHEDFTTALQEKDLYVYCGHSVGRFLASSGFHLLNCHATALLAGCSSGRLTVSGRCDPVGIPLSYLMAGCPALVGCLWDVTDGEIDRLCHALLNHFLGNSDEATPLPSLVAASRTACKLQWLTGAATIVYGIPVIVDTTAAHS